jgi:hypothetical protein
MQFSKLAIHKLSVTCTHTRACMHTQANTCAYVYTQCTHRHRHAHGCATHRHAHACTYTRWYTYMCTNIHTGTCMYTCKHRHTSTYRFSHIHIDNTCVCMHVHRDTGSHMYTHMHTWGHAGTCIHMHTQRHLGTHTSTCPCWLTFPSHVVFCLGPLFTCVCPSRTDWPYYPAPHLSSVATKSACWINANK